MGAEASPARARAQTPHGDGDARPARRGEGDEPGVGLALREPQLRGPRLARDLDAGDVGGLARAELDDADHEPAQVSAICAGRDARDGGRAGP